MQIIVKLDKETVMKYHKRGSPILFEIFWEQDGVSYPEKGWTDFGTVVLGWWFYVIDQFRSGISHSKFAFMDGPYSIAATYNADTGIIELTPDGFDRKWSLTLAHLKDELISAADKVCKELLQFGTGEQERLVLEKSIKHIKSNLRQ